MSDQASVSCKVPLAATVVIVAVAACAGYANLSLAVTDPADYRFFPPFRPLYDENRNFELGGENFEISRSLVAGRGFASPFKEPTGPTAWMPPALPLLQAGLLWAFGGNRDAVMAVVIVLQAGALVATGLLVLALARQTTRRLGSAAVVGLFILGMIGHFLWWFQRTHDSFLVLLVLDLLVAWASWWGPLNRYGAAAGWGLFGGAGALVSPIVGFVWGGLSLALAGRRRAWGPLAVALAAAALVLAPWTARNWLVFGRPVPVKSNLAYELYQSQCLQPDGLMQRNTIGSHPYQSAGRERREYRALGEAALMDRKWRQFCQAVAADPLDFGRRVADRLLAATLWYVPFDRALEAKRPWLLWLRRLAHALPLVGLLTLAVASAWRPLSAAEWVVIGAYLLYLLPYVVVSYYERYAAPLLGVKVLLVAWGADRWLACFSRPFPRGRHEPSAVHPLPAEAVACPRASRLADAGPPRRGALPG
jgi:hypothetical protein